MMIRQFDLLLPAGLLLAAGLPTIDQDAVAQGTTVPQRNNQSSPAGIVPEPPTGTEITQQGSPGFVQSLVVATCSRSMPARSRSNARAIPRCAGSPAG
jgi:hypothetical protein